MNIYSREEMLIGKEGLLALKNSHVLLLGLGGVGGSAFEGLVRGGVGTITVVDSDKIDKTNINRQALAFETTVGRLKVDVASEFAKNINPDIEIRKIEKFVMEEDISFILGSDVDYVIDCIDTVSTKIALAVYCEKENIPLISCMGTGNKLHPELLKIEDIFKTKVCPLSRVMRRELKNKNVSHLKVCYSEEKPIKTNTRTPGSISFVPPVAGLIMVGEVIRFLIGGKNEHDESI